MDSDKSRDKKHRLVVSYKGDKGTHILRSMENYVKKLLPKMLTLQITYSGKKLGSQFNIKYKTNSEQQHDLTYRVNCPISTCEDNYIRKIARRIHELIKGYNGRD